jgi:UDPglucose 6-dehydrogenase
MNILYIGSGFVGSCSAAVSADSGHTVLVYDIDKTKISLLGSNNAKKIESCIFEEGLSDMLVRNKKRIHFTTDYKKVISFLDTCDAIFMCLPTPEIGETGESDLKYYFAAAEELGKHLAKRNRGTQKKYVVIVNKSTVPIDMIDTTETIFNAHGVENYGVVSNPEFLVEGKAIEGSIHPERVVVGATKEKDFEVMRQVYQRFHGSSSIQYLETNPKEAAAGKLLANFVLFNKLAVCFDVLGRTCEKFSGIQFEQVRRILMSDPRIGSWGLYDSLYAGGSCFIKDARSLSHQLQTAGQNASLVNETYTANKRQLEMFIGRAEKEAGFVWKGKKVALLGTAFKQDTNDIRNSPSIDIVNHANEQRVASVSVFDPAALPMFKAVMKGNKKIRFADSEESCLKQADVVIIATDWPQFRGVADLLLKNSGKKKPLIMDGRRILQHRYAELTKAGFTIIAVGSPLLSAN